MRMKAFGVTDAGRRPGQNEDTFCVDPDLGLLAVADGIGGRAGGEVASRLAMQAFRGQLMMDASRQAGHSELDLLSKASEAANSLILERVAEEPELQGMGTTFTACWVRGQSAHFVHVGDSRGYLLRHGRLAQLTEDHTVGNLRRRKGNTSTASPSHDGGSKLLAALGTSRWVSADFFTEQLQAGDLLLLCTDGLSVDLGTQELHSLVQRPLPLEERCASLVNLAREQGGTDDITVVLASFQNS